MKLMPQKTRIKKEYQVNDYKIRECRNRISVLVFCLLAFFLFGLQSKTVFADTTKIEEISISYNPYDIDPYYTYEQAYANAVQDFQFLSDNVTLKMFSFSSLVGTMSDKTHVQATDTTCVYSVELVLKSGYAWCDSVAKIHGQKKLSELEGFSVYRNGDLVPETVVERDAVNSPNKIVLGIPVPVHTEGVIESVAFEQQNFAMGKGESYQFHPVIKGNHVNKTCSFEIENATSSKTNVDANGTVTVGEDESAEYITLKVSSNEEKRRTDSLLIKILNQKPIIESVVFTSGKNELYQDQGNWIYAKATGSQTDTRVKFELIGNASSKTYIEEYKDCVYLHVDLEEEASTVSIKATSVYDPTVFATWDVKILRVSIVNRLSFEFDDKDLFLNRVEMSDDIMKRAPSIVMNNTDKIDETQLTGLGHFTDSSTLEVWNRGARTWVYGDYQYYCVYCPVLKDKKAYSWPREIREQEKMQFVSAKAAEDYFAIEVNGEIRNDVIIGYSRADGVRILIPVPIHENGIYLDQYEEVYVQPGKTYQFTPTILGDFTEPKVVSWEVKGTDSPASFSLIDEAGNLTVAPDEQAKELEVVVSMSCGEGIFSDSFIAYVTDQEPVIEKVEIEEGNQELYPGEKYTFTANVEGSYKDKSVSWKVTGNKSLDTVINKAGILTIAEDETASSLIVTATANKDQKKSGSVEITVPTRTAIQEVELSYDLDYINLIASENGNDINERTKKCVGVSTEHIAINHAQSIMMVETDFRSGIYFPISKAVPMNVEYRIRYELSLSEKRFMWPDGVKNCKSEKSIKTLKDFIVKTNGEVRDDVSVQYEDSYIYVFVPVGKATCNAQPKPYSKKANCIENGTESCYYCEYCKGYFEDIEATKWIADINSWGVIPKNGIHTYDQGQVLKNATCTKKGLLQKICTVCGEGKIEEEIPILAHTPEDVKTGLASCIQDGLTIGSKCAVCGEVLKEQQFAKALGHEWIEVDSQTTKCSRCGEEKKKELVSLAKGTRAKDEITGATVLVLDSIKQEVAFVEPKDAKKKTISVPATVRLYGVTYRVIKIQDGAFKKNKNVTKIVLPNSIAVIGKNAFSGCKKLKTISIPKNVTEIGANAFRDCASLNKITIPGKVQKIGTNCFLGCKKCKSILVKTTKLKEKSIGKNAFKAIPKTATMKVPKKQLKNYKKYMSKKGYKGKVKA